VTPTKNTNFEIQSDYGDDSDAMVEEMRNKPVDRGNKLT